MCLCFLMIGLISLGQKYDFSSGVLAWISFVNSIFGVYLFFYAIKYEYFSLTVSGSAARFGKTELGTR